MAQEPSSRDLLEAVKQQESGGRRYDKSGKLLEGPPTKYGTAKGEMQVLDMTNRDPGFGVRPAKDDSPDERARVGRDYLAAMTKRYGDTETGLIAYNWGPGNTDKWIKRGADPAKLPKETQNYVAKIMASLGGTDVLRGTTAVAAAPKKAAPKPVAVAGTTPKRPAPVAAAPAAVPVTVASMDSKLADLGPSYQAALALSFLADTDEKEDRDIDREPGVAEKYLAEMEAAPRPAALSEFIDVKIRSPFAEAEQPEQPVGMAEGGEVADKDAQGDTSDALSNEPIGLLDKYRMFSWMEKNYPEMLTYNNNEPAVFLSIMRGQSTYSDTDPQEQLLRKRKVNPVAEPDFFQKQPGEPVFPQRREMSRPENFDYPRLERGDDPALERKEMEKLLGQRNLGTFYANGGVVRRAGGSPKTGEVGYFQDPLGVPDSGPVTADTLAKGKEFSAADALRVLKEMGTDVARNVKNIAKGTTETPYNLVGSVADIGNMVLTPLGLGSAEPFLGSAQLKRLATEAGIRPAPPTDPRDAGFYMMGELGSSVLNPAGVVRSGVKAATKGKKAAEMLAKDFQAYNQALGPAGVSYAVRNKGTPYTVSYGPIKGPDGNYLAPMDDAQKYVKEEVAITGDSKLNDWLSDKVTSYLRRDFATPDDQFVKAAKDNQLLHFVNKPIPKRPDLDPYYDRIKDFSSIKNLPYVRKREGFNSLGEVEDIESYAKRVEDLTDASAYPAQLEDVATKNIPSRMRDMVETDPTARLTELAPNINKMLQLDDLAISMEKMRSMPKTYSAYSQPAIKVPEEYLFTDKALGGLTPAQASNRVATFRNWQQENRQRMASKFMKEDPRLDREELSGKFTAVALPDLQKSPELKQLAMDVGCDGNWCTKKQADALGYGSGPNRLHIILDEKARPLAQLTLYERPPSIKQLQRDSSAGKTYSITDLLGKDNSKDFSKNPALPAIQQYVKSLDNKYGLVGVANLKEIKMKEMDAVDLIRGATELSQLRQRYKPGITQDQYEAASAPDLPDLTAKVRELNGGSRFFTSDQDTKDLVQQALKILAPQQRAMGGMVQGYAKGGIADLPKGYDEEDFTTLKPFLPTTTPTANTTGIATLIPNTGNPNAAANQAAAFAKLTPAQLAQHQVQLAMISDAKPIALQLAIALKDAVQNAINNSTSTSSGGVSSTSGSPMGGIASKGTVGQANAAVAAANAALGNAIGGGSGGGSGGGTSGGGTSGSGMGGMGTGAAGAAASAAATGRAMGGMIERQFIDNRRYM